MTQLVEKSRSRRAFDRADILLLMGETVRIDVSPRVASKTNPDLHPVRPPNPPARRAVIEEEVERWDGLS